MTDIHELQRRLRERLVARLAVRWPEAHAYIPEGGSRILCASPMDERDQALLEIYKLAYQDAMQDTAAMLGTGSQEDETPMSVLVAEGSVFQGGTHPPSLTKKAKRKRGRRGPAAPARGARRSSAASGRGQRHYSAARLAAEALFEKNGGGDGV